MSKKTAVLDKDGKSYGFYFDAKRKRFVHRPWVNGRRTERTLDARTEAAAVREFLKLDGEPDSTITVGKLIQAYLDAGTPGSGVTARDGDFAKHEKARCKSLAAFFGSMKAADVDVSHALEYKKWRVRRVKNKNATGHRAVNYDLDALFNVFRYARYLRPPLVKENPMEGRPKFATDTEHCYDHCCRSGDELQTVAAALARTNTPFGALLTLQYLLEATSGSRTNEVLPLRRDAEPGQPGHQREEAGQVYLCIARLKQGDNDPFEYVKVNSAMAAVLKALEAWHAKAERKSHWFFPSRKTTKDSHMCETALVTALRRVTAKLLPGRRLTSHGARAFYVTWRRVQKADLHQIAAEIGHLGGVSLLLTTYGRRIPQWAEAEFSPFPKTVRAFWDEQMVSPKLAEQADISTTVSTSSGRIYRHQGTLAYWNGASEVAIPQRDECVATLQDTRPKILRDVR